MNAQNDNERAAIEIATRLNANGHKALFAGGWVRDRLLGNRQADDIDIATDATPNRITEIFSNVVPVGEKFGVMLVLQNGIPFEVATFRTDQGIGDGRRPGSIAFSSPEEDALRRDFTINGLFFDPRSQTVYDYVNGRQDLKKGVIRAIGNPSQRFREDYLRLLRGIRFASRFGFDIDSATWEAICDCADGIVEISQERVFQELTKILTGPAPDRALELLHVSGLLARVLPEINDLVGVEQPEQFHPEGDVFTHTLKALSLTESPSEVAAWSILLHDIGKPVTMTYKQGDRVRFNNHDRAGARMARMALRRLKASRNLISEVSDCIDNHMNFMNVTKMRLSTLKKFLARPTLEDELELHRVDCLASHGDLENYDFLVAKRSELPVEEVKPAPFINGKDLIHMGLLPGAVFGKILGAVYDLQLEDHVTSRDQALEWVRNHLDEFIDKQS